MARIRFSIASMLGLVLFVGVGVAALRAGSDLWDSGLLTLTVAFLLISVLLAIHRTEKRRAYWIGFSLFGSAYLGASLVPAIEARLLTTKGLAYLDSHAPRENQYLLGWIDLDGVKFTSTQRGVLWLSSGTSENFVRIGHSLIALILAFLGGHLSRYFCHREQQATQASATVAQAHADA